MNGQQYQQLVDSLGPQQRLVLDALREHGPLTDTELVDVITQSFDLSRSTIIPRRTELVRKGLARGAGSRASAIGKRRTIFEVVPPEDVEQAQQTADDRGPRRLEVRKWPFEDQVRVAQALLRDPAVNEAIRVAAEPGSRRARARARQEAERSRRERARQIKNTSGELVAFLRLQDILKRNVDAVREVGFFLEDEIERDAAYQPRQIPEGIWLEILRLLEDAIGINEETYELIARHIGHSSRTSVGIVEGRLSQLAPPRPLKVVGGVAAPSDS
jgi:hypothetical protein